MPAEAVKVLIIGAGVGGLSCAIHLGAAGYDVRVFERASGPGGKARVIDVDGALVDAGPTVLTMPWVFEDLFGVAGRSLRDEVVLTPSKILARHAWQDGTRFDLHASVEDTTRDATIAFGAREARAYREFLEYARGIYDAVEEPFLRSQRPTLGSVWKYGGNGVLKALSHIDAFRSMWRSLEKQFADSRLRQLFARYATYCGASPFDAPATLNLIAYVESRGVYRVQGGMRALATGLERVAKSFGVQVEYDVDITRLLARDGRVRGALVRGEVHEADAVVFNGDISALGALLSEGKGGGKAVAVEDRSLSAVTIAASVRARGFPLLHHNVFFSRDYAAEFGAIIGRAQVPEDPTIYVCAQDRGDDAAPLERERVLVTMNAPATGDREPWNDLERARCQQLILSALERHGLTLEPMSSVMTTPADFHRLFPSTGGSLYGPAVRSPLSALARQAAASKIKGLYVAGGSVHPGPGVPMAALSGRLAAERIREDLPSIVRYPTAGTSGTTSTV